MEHQQDPSVKTETAKASSLVSQIIEKHPTLCPYNPKFLA